MKSIFEYLSTNILYLGFPKNPTKENMVKFLDSKGFIKIDSNRSYKSFVKISDDLENNNDPSYIIEEDFYWLAFHNGGKITKDNPVFFIRFNVQDTRFDDDFYIIWYETLNISTVAKQQHEYRKTQYNEVLEIINKQFL